MKKVISPAGYHIYVAETSWFTFGFEGHFNLFWIAIRDIKNKYLLKHELIHYDQYKKNKWNFIKCLWDMDVLVDLEIEAYIDGSGWLPEQVASVVSERYHVFHFGKLFGCRTRQYSYTEVYKKALEYVDRKKT